MYLRCSKRSPAHSPRMAIALTLTSWHLSFCAVLVVLKPAVALAGPDPPTESPASPQGP